VTTRPWPWLRAQAHARQIEPAEACGLFVVVQGREQFIACRNVADDPLTAFEIDPVDYEAAERRGEIVAVFHSHPGDLTPKPSAIDERACNALGLPWRIYAPGLDQWHVLLPKGWQEPLEGRDWSWGQSDCWSLVRDWFAQERGIELRDWTRPAMEAFNAAPMFDECWAATGFSEIAAGELQCGDCLLIDRTGNGADHVAVYLGDNNMLHHLIDQKSRIDLYSEYWMSVTKRCLRYKRNDSTEQQ
jgi:cell wall-associated NlpC family hydrolase